MNADDSRSYLSSSVFICGSSRISPRPPRLRGSLFHALRLKPPAMIDLKDLRENPDRYRRAAQLKRIDVDIDRLLDLDARRRQLDAERQKLTAEKNASGKQIGQLAGQIKKAPPDQRAALEAQMKQLQARPTELKQQEQA